MSDNQTVALAGAALPTPRRRIRVLHLIYSVCHGGIETALLNWWKAFDRSRFDIYVAYFAGDRNREEPFVRAARAEGVEPLLTVPWSRWKPFLRAARAVARIVREHQIDIVHTHAYYADAVGAIARRMTGVKTITTVYVWGDYELHRQIMQWMDWIAINHIDKVTAHCKDTFRKTVERGYPEEKLGLLISGFPVDREPPTPERRRRARQAAGVTDEEVVLLNVARLAPEKAQDQLLKSFRIIHDHFPNTRLWISGVGLDFVERDLLRLQRELGLEGSAEFVGYRHDIWSLLDAADIMVHPSHVEGVPLALLYGMAAALPIVASAVGGVPEIIRPGRTGALVAENDVQGFAETVIRLIEDRAEARRLGGGARRFVETDYSLETAVRRVEKTYQEVLAS